ncbi:MAG: PD-(D/E)XK nuclease family protein [Candidatus Poseidoniaceae archaeon]|nr:PD-(D/E)XK nuclease family protein [Candidatus Poseidoniaceae archaeon]
MPFGKPPLGGPLGKSRSRISASGLTTFLRCKTQWFLSSKLGLSGPFNTSQVLGIVIEDCFCEILMKRPKSINSFEELKLWANSFVEEYSIKAMDRGEELWLQGIWHKEGASWDDVELESIKYRISCGLELFLEEVENCYNAGGGPYLESFRKGDFVFEINSPAWGEEPIFPIPDKVNNFTIRKWSIEENIEWQEENSPVSWCEAWEIARPWVKDPRVHQPQRLFHPEGWAAGELDLVLRWDGRIRIIDIKSGNPESKFAVSLIHQLRFYSWLWRETHDGEVIDGMEGWYLDGAHRVTYDAPTLEEYDSMSTEFKQVHSEMQSMGEGPAVFPNTQQSECKGEQAGCHWCGVSRDDSGVWTNSDIVESITKKLEIEIKPPFEMLSEIPSRVTVKGKFTGSWGPLPNHFSEPVLGAMLSSGQKQITIEESEPGSFPTLHDCPNEEVVIIDALPGVWRGNSRLYVDSKTKILTLEESEEYFSSIGKEASNAITRVGLLRTRANAEGFVLSIRKRNGIRLDGKPWTMLNMYIWDGHNVVEVVAFGSSINSQMESITKGQKVGLIGAEIGWRAGLPQLRIDSRNTRITVKN